MSNLADLFARCGPVELASKLSPEAVALAIAEKRAMRVTFSPDILTIDPSVYASLDLEGEPPHLVFETPIPDELRFVLDEVREIEDHVTDLVIHFVKRGSSDD